MCNWVTCVKYKDTFTFSHQLLVTASLRKGGERAAKKEKKKNSKKRETRNLENNSPENKDRKAWKEGKGQKIRS